MKEGMLQCELDADGTDALEDRVIDHALVIQHAWRPMIESMGYARGPFYTGDSTRA